MVRMRYYCHPIWRINNSFFCWRVVSVGAVFALFTSLLGAMFPLPRVLYAMSADGLLFNVFQRVNNKTKTPLLGTLISGFIAAVMALIFDLHQLIDMMSIGNHESNSAVWIFIHFTYNFRHFDGLHHCCRVYFGAALRNRWRALSRKGFIDVGTSNTANVQFEWLEATKLFIVDHNKSVHCNVHCVYGHFLYAHW